MNVSIGDRWEEFINNTVKAGRYNSASEVVREGLRLVEEHETKLMSLRDALNTSINEGGQISDEELEIKLAAKELELSKAGFE
jgi:antitoxin ParD1/3/4